jgi:chemotaxis protein histidine kinase CheA
VSTTRNNAYPDLATTRAIASELAGSVTDILADLPSFFATPDAKPLTPKLSGVYSTLSFIGLRAVEITVERAVKLASHIEAAGTAPSESQRNALSAVLNAIHDYLSTAAAGHIKPGVVLHPAFVAATGQVPGATSLTRAQLFLPVWPHNRDDAEVETPGYEESVREYRRELKDALDVFVEAPASGALLRVRSSLATIETKLPPAQIRHLVSLTIAYIDARIALDAPLDADEVDLRTSVSTICEESRSPIVVPHTLVSSMLALISQHAESTERTRHFSQIYDLRRLAVGSTVTGEQLAEAIDACANAKYAWQDVTADLDHTEALKDSSLALAKTASVLENSILRTLTLTFATLVDGIASGTLPGLRTPAIVDGVPNGKTAMREDIAIFGASLLLGITEQVSMLGVGRSVDRELVDYYKQAVRSVLSGSVPTWNRPLNPTALVFPELMEQVSDTLQALEATVDSAFRGDNEEAALSEIEKQFALVRSTLEFMQLDRAATVTENIRLMTMQALATSSPSEAGSNQAKLAAPVTKLGAYLAVAAVDSHQAETLLVDLEAEMKSEPESAQASAVSIVNEFDVCSDPDLGPIFFDEAISVLNETIAPGLEALQADPANRAVLVDVRRGFHTLKGSARMVGLVNLGKLAEAVEYALNVARDNHGAQINAEMITWITGSAGAFRLALTHLQQNRPAPLDPRPFTEAYDRFRTSGTFGIVMDDKQVAGQIVESQAEPTTEEEANPSSKQIRGGLHSEAGTDTGGDHHDPAETGLPGASTSSEPLILSLATPGDELETICSESGAIAIATVDLGNSSGLSLAPTGAEIDSAADDDVVTVCTASSELTFASSEAADEHLSEQRLDVLIKENRSGKAFPDDAEDGHTSGPHERITDEAEPEGSDSLGQHAHTEALLTQAVGGDMAVAQIAGNQAGDAQDSEALPASEVDTNEQNIQIGALTIDRDLHSTFVEEASHYVAAMNEQLADVVEGRSRRIGFEFYRMAHSLVGMGRATGFTPLTDVAAALEEWAEINQAEDIMISKTSATTLTDAMRHLTWTVQSIAEKHEPPADRWIVDNMRSLVRMNQEFVIAGSRVERAEIVRPEKRETLADPAGDKIPQDASRPPAESAPNRAIAKATSAARPAAGVSGAQSRVSKGPSAKQPAGASGTQPASARNAALRKYKKAPAKPDTVTKAIVEMVARAFRSVLRKITGK